jgi:hypothetical protein
MNYRLRLFLLGLVVAFIITILVTMETYRPSIDKPSTVTATDVLNDNLKDPVIVSRAYFTDTIDGPIGEFTGYPSSWSEDNRLHSFSHEKP